MDLSTSSKTCSIQPNDQARNLQNTAPVPQFFDYLLILDFEATCLDKKQISPQEIIEFPCLKFNTKTLKIDSTFHKYVQPDVHSTLTPFCTELTGISQSMVDGQQNFTETLLEFEKWMVEEKLKSQDGQILCKFTFVTCGDWDLKTQLPNQCKFLGIDVPDYFLSWINLKKPFGQHTNKFRIGMMRMLKLLNIEHEGRHHSGIDDVKNIANIVKALIECNVVFQIL